MRQHKTALLRLKEDAGFVPGHLFLSQSATVFRKKNWLLSVDRDIRIRIWQGHWVFCAGITGKFRDLNPSKRSDFTITLSCRICRSAGYKNCNKDECSEKMNDCSSLKNPLHCSPVHIEDDMTRLSDNKSTDISHGPKKDVWLGRIRISAWR